MLTTGEEAMIGNSAQDGANSRTFEIYAKPVDELDLASKMHEVSEQHYGHAGRVFVDKLSGLKPKKLNELYDDIKARLHEKFPQSVHINEVAVVCLGDYLSSMYVYEEDHEEAMAGALDNTFAVLENNRQLTQADSAQRAWEMFTSWIISNSKKFDADAPPPHYGRKDEEGRYLVFPLYAHKALEEAGFSSRKAFKGFAERRYIESKIDSEGILRYQLGRSMDGKTCRVYVVNLPDGDFRPLDGLSESLMPF